MLSHPPLLLLLPPLLSLLLSTLLRPAAARINCFPRTHPAVPTNPSPETCLDLLSHLPTSAIARTIPPPHRSFPSMPFLPRALYHAPSCIVRLRFSLLPPRVSSNPLYRNAGETGPDLAGLGGYPPIFELYAAMKHQGTQVVHMCTGQGKSGGTANGVIRGIFWDVAVAPGPDAVTWDAVVSVPQRLSRGQHGQGLGGAAPGWGQTIWEVE